MALRIEKTVRDGRPCWIKRPEPPLRRIWTLGHRLAAPLLPRVFRPTQSQGGEAALRAEAGRLEALAKAGLPAPRVLELQESHLLLSDAGAPFEAHLRGLDSSAVGPALARAAEALAALHAAGLCHGRPHLRDMAINEAGAIAFLDFEEEPLRVMTLAESQARDIWLFLSSAAQFYGEDEAGLAALYAAYAAKAPDGVKAEIPKLLRGLRPLVAIVDSLGLRWFGKDVVRPYRAAKAMREGADAHPPRAGLGC